MLKWKIFQFDGIFVKNNRVWVRFHKFQISKLDQIIWRINLKLICFNAWFVKRNANRLKKPWDMSFRVGHILAKFITWPLQELKMGLLNLVHDFDLYFNFATLISMILKKKKHFAVLNSNGTIFTWIWSLYWYSSSTTNCIHTCMCLQLLWIFRWAIKVNVTSYLNLQNVEINIFFVQIYVLLQGGVRFLIFFCKVTFWFDSEFLHIRIFNWNITYNLL